MTTSILNDVKRAIDLAEDYTAFDQVVLMHINSALSTLSQLGVGPPFGLFIENTTTKWDALFGTDPRFNMIKSYIYLKVRLLFDPPSTSYLITASEKMLEEYTWRISAEREFQTWVPPTTILEETEDVVLDGGTP